METDQIRTEIFTKETYAYAKMYKRDLIIWIQIISPVHMKIDQIHLGRSTKGTCA